MTHAISRIMAVDDEHFICSILEEFLSLHGFEVATAGGGAEALALEERVEDFAGGNRGIR